MKRVKTLLILAVLAFGVAAGWQAGSSELANAELQEDMTDLASQVGAYSNYAVQRSDDDFREAVIRKAEDHDIQLRPSQVTVTRTGSGMTSKIYLAADYNVPVQVLSYSYVLHFTPNSRDKRF